MICLNSIIIKISSRPFRTADQSKDCYRISITGNLTGDDAKVLRDEISKISDSDYDTIYLDVKGVPEIDLTGTNELINSHYLLREKSKELILLYKKDSDIQKWVELTGLDKFIPTAWIPQS